MSSISDEIGAIVTTPYRLAHCLKHLTRNSAAVVSEKRGQKRAKSGPGPRPALAYSAAPHVLKNKGLARRIAEDIAAPPYLATSPNHCRTEV